MDIVISLAQACTTQIMPRVTKVRRASNVSSKVRRTEKIMYNFAKVVFRNKLQIVAGQIESTRGPLVAGGTHAVQT